MSRCAIFLSVTLLVLGCTGCAGSRAVSSEPPRSLDEVNRVLEGRVVQVEFIDGTVVPGERVTMMSDSMHFLADRTFESAAVDEVRRITYERARFSPGQGLVGGALVGGFISLPVLLDDDSFVPGSAIAVIVMAGTATLGLIFGLLEQFGEQERVAYEGPVSRYAGAEE